MLISIHSASYLLCSLFDLLYLTIIISKKIGSECCVHPTAFNQACSPNTGYALLYCRAGYSGTHQIDRIVRDGGPATYIGRDLPDHLGVITGHRASLVKRTDRSVIIIHLFVDPALE